MISNNYYGLCTAICVLISAFTSIYGSENKKLNYKSLEAIGKNLSTLSNKQLEFEFMCEHLKTIEEDNLNSLEPNSLVVNIGSNQLYNIVLTPSTTSTKLATTIREAWSLSDLTTKPSNSSILQKRCDIINSIFKVFDLTLPNKLTFKNNSLSSSSKINKKMTFQDLKECANRAVVFDVIYLALCEIQKRANRINSSLNENQIKEYCKQVTCFEDKALITIYLACMQLCRSQIEISYLFTHVENVPLKYHHIFHIHKQAYLPYREMVVMSIHYWANSRARATQDWVEKNKILYFNQLVKFAIKHLPKTNGALQNILIEMHDAIKKRGLISFDKIPVFIHKKPKKWTVKSEIKDVPVDNYLKQNLIEIYCKKTKTEK